MACRQPVSPPQGKKRDRSDKRGKWRKTGLEWASREGHLTCPLPYSFLRARNELIASVRRPPATSIEFGRETRENRETREAQSRCTGVEDRQSQMRNLRS